jgi:tetratricopeptide (TPR) repeat protein
MASRACLFLSVALCAIARAQPAPDPLVEARRLHGEGAAAYRLGHYDEAIERFEASYRLTNLAALMFDIAQAHRKLYEERHEPEHLRRAVELYQRYLRDAPHDAARRGDASVLLPPLEQTLAEHERGAMVERAVGREGLAIADQLIADNTLEVADRALDHLLKTPGNSRELVGGAWMRRGLVAIKRGARADAAQALLRALSLGATALPEIESDDAWREAERKLGGATLAIASTIAPVAAGQPLRVPVRVIGDPTAAVERVSAACRRGDGAWSEGSAAAGATEIALAVVPAADSRLECYLIAYGAVDAELARAGSPEAPIRVSVVAPSAPPRAVERARPWHRRWWVWTLVGGVVVAGLAIGLGVGYGTSGGPTTLHVPVP